MKIVVAELQPLEQLSHKVVYFLLATLLVPATSKNYENAGEKAGRAK